MKATGHFNQLTEGQAERLALLSEECAEAIQAVSKILRHGLDSINPLLSVPDDENPITNQMSLEKELGHVVCAMRKLRHAGDLRESEIDRYADEKSGTIKRWMHHQ